MLSDLPLDTVANITAILASLAVIATTVFVWRQMRLQALGQDTDERRFLRESIHVIHETLQAEQFSTARQSFFAGAHEQDYSDMVSADRAKARYILSIYGLLARMVKHGAIDEVMLREYWETALYRDWDRLENFVSGERLRARNGNLFAATEKTVARWKQARE